MSYDLHIIIAKALFMYPNTRSIRFQFSISFQLTHIDGNNIFNYPILKLSRIHDYMLFTHDCLNLKFFFLIELYIKFIIFTYLTFLNRDLTSEQKN